MTKFGIVSLLLTALFALPLLAQPVKYGLSVGVKAPEIDTRDIDGKNFILTREINAGPVVLVFYRGGWCPYL